MKTIVAVLIGGAILMVVIFVLSKDAMPGSGLYNFKRVEEKVEGMTIVNSEKKAAFYEELIDTRLKEIQYVVTQRDYPLVLSTTLRYSTTVGDATQFVESHGLKKEAASLDKLLESQKGSLENMAKNTPGDGYHRDYLTDAYNYVLIYQPRLQNVAK